MKPTSSESKSSQAEFFERNGYASLGKLLSPESIDDLKAHAQQLWQEELEERQHGKRAGDADFRNYHFEGAHLYNSPRRSRQFDPLLENLEVLALMEEIFGCPAILSQTELRNPFKEKIDSHAYNWHRDGRVLGEHNFWIIVFWMLDDVCRSNGATQIKPGTHHSDVHDESVEPVYLEGQAGQAFLVHSNISHRATVNSTGQDRWLFLPTYNPWFIKPSMDYTKAFSRETFNSFSDPLKQIFGYTSLVPCNERKRLYTRADWRDVVDEIPFPSSDIDD